MRIIELASDAEFDRIYPLVKLLNPSLAKPLFRKRLKAMRAQGYRCIAAVENDAYLGISGFWFGMRFWCGSYVDIDNIVVTEGRRGKNIGQKLVAWIEAEARKSGVEMAVLDSYASNHGSHRFYFREGYIIKGYHFTKNLETNGI